MKCYLVNRRSAEMMKTKSSTPSWKMSLCIPSRCPRMPFPSCRKYVDRQVKLDPFLTCHQLLTRDPTRRLGAGPDDALEIKNHPFFKDVNWGDVLNKRIPPPYFPQIKAPGDVSNFDTEFTKEQPTLTPVHGQLTQKDQMEFQGFSWVRFIDHFIYKLYISTRTHPKPLQCAAWAQDV